MADPAAHATRFECIIPILRVRDLQLSLDHYQRVLGFRKDWPEGDGPHAMVGLSRDGQALYLCQEDQGQPGTWVWVGVEDVEALYGEYRSAGARIVQEPTDYPWAYEMRVEDPDGHILRMGSSPRSG